jgi:hypothetical protein
LGNTLVHLIKEGGDVGMAIMLPYEEDSDRRKAGLGGLQRVRLGLFSSFLFFY